MMKTTAGQPMVLPKGRPFGVGWQAQRFRCEQMCVVGVAARHKVFMSC